MVSKPEAVMVMLFLLHVVGLLVLSRERCDFPPFCGPTRACCVKGTHSDSPMTSAKFYPIFTKSIRPDTSRHPASDDEGTRRETMTVYDGADAEGTAAKTYSSHNITSYSYYLYQYGTHFSMSPPFGMLAKCLGLLGS